MAAVTKQAATRDLVLDLIEQLSVGDSIPSERQLSADFGVSRLTVRAALDDLVREGHLVRRHGSGTFVSEPKIAQELVERPLLEIGCCQIGHVRRADVHRLDRHALSIR